MVTPTTPKLALGSMAMNIYDKITNHIIDVEIDRKGVQKVYSLILSLDALLCSYRDSMNLFRYNPKMEKVILTNYYNAKVELDREERILNWHSSTDFHKWNLWFWKYLQLLSSCFNVIGLAPREMKTLSAPVIKDPLPEFEGGDDIVFYDKEGNPMVIE